MWQKYVLQMIIYILQAISDRPAVTANEQIKSRLIFSQKFDAFLDIRMNDPVIQNKIGKLIAAEHWCE